MENRRRAIVAGSFYSADRQSLEQQIKDCFLHQIGPQALPSSLTKEERKIMGVISPHAGFMFSGPVAAHGYFQLSLEKTPKTIILLGPNHQNIGEKISIMTSGQWETPLGVVEIDRVVVENILVNDEEGFLYDDPKSHLYEHSIEVQLPFLQFIYPSNNFKIIPISIANQQLDIMRYLSQVIYKTISDRHEEFLLIASSDFNHYENQKSTEFKDSESIKEIIKMDSNLFYDSIHKNKASICGPGPISIVIETCKKLGIRKGELLKYATSGDVSGMFDEVVGYASIVFR